jgi:hypothetical protein
MGLALWLGLAWRPGLSPLDAGDFATASALLGVAHPPGFVAAVQGGAATLLLPLGGWAGRAGLWSLLATLLAGTLAARALARTGLPTPWAAAAPVAWVIATPAMAVCATQPEAYAWHMACLMACTLAAWTWTHGGDARAGLLAVATGCLAATGHPLAWLQVPALLATAALLRRPRGVHLALAPFPVVVGALAWAWLAVASAREPLHNWGAPHTWAAWLDHVSGASIRAGLADAMGGGWSVRAVWLGRLLDASAPAGRWGWLALAAALAAWGGGRLRGGAGAGLRPALHLAALLLAPALVELGYGAWINPMGLRDWQVGHGLGLVWWCGAAAVGAGVLAGRPVLQGAAACGALAGAVLAAPLGAGELRRPVAFTDLVLGHAGSAAPGSVTLWGSDDLTATALWWQAVGDVRPDALWAGRHMLGDPRNLARVDRLGGVELAGDRPVNAPRDEVFGRAVPWMVQQGLPRGLAWEVSGLDAELPPGVPWRPGIPVATVGVEAGEADWAGLDAAWQAVAVGSGDRFVHRWLASQWVAAAAWHFRRQDWVGAGRSYERALAVNPESAALRAGLAACLASAGRVDAALEVAQQALAMDALNRTAWENAVRYARFLGRAPALASLEAQGRRMGWTAPP